MPYTIKLMPFDLGGFYAAGFPAFTGVLSEVPLSIGPLIATTTPASLTLSYPAAPDPPTPRGWLGSLYVADPAGPGDLFRSGPIIAWPPSPATLMFGTGVTPVPFGTIKVDLPFSKNLDAGVTAGAGAATLGQFIPFKVTITRLNFGPSPTPGAIRARFSGTISYFTLFLPRRSDMSGTVDVTLTPAGDALGPATFVNVTASNLSLSPSFITPLSTPLLALLAPAFSGALSGPLTDKINSMISDKVPAIRMSVPLGPNGQPLLSPAATISIRRITVVPSGLIVQAVLAELTASAAPVTPTGPPPKPEPGAKPRFLVSIEPEPEEEVAKTYLVSVRKADDGSLVQDATVAITTYTAVLGNAVTVSTSTDAQGLAALEVTLRSRYRPGDDPTNTGTLQRTPPALRVTKHGFEDFLLDL
ncbi:MAG TPA: hypothetical protein VKU77_28435 [Streptosporangiaceae bacterium]|nr:hypothetical protein [Streptosporangiaceae bacterium]